MGQIIGKAKIKEEALPFINLPRSLIYDLRQTVYEVAEGYGLTLQELREIIRLCLREFVRIPETNIDECSDALFHLFSDDEASSESKQQQLIDSFEVLATIGLTSGMELNEKINFMFDLFDFNETGDLNLNETTLAFRTIMSGASKVVRLTSPVDLDFIDRVAIEAFESLSSKNNLNLSSVAIATDDGRLNRNKFFNYVFDCAEAHSILNHFDNICHGVIQVLGNVRNTSTPVPPLRFNTTSEVDTIDTSVKAPWRDQIRFLRTQNDDESTTNPPATSLSIDWIYGRNTQGPEVLYGTDGSILYAAGTTVVKLSVDRSEQHYFMQHSGHITSIDILQTKDFGEVVASADIGFDSRICIWSVADMTSIVTIPRFHQYGVSKIRFSPSGELLLTLGNCTNTLAVYNWRTRESIFTARVPEIDVYNCSFLGSDQRFGVCGGTSVHFWARFDDTWQYNQSNGVFNCLSTKEVMTCLTHSEGSVLSGSSTGRLWLWEGRVCLKLLHAFPSPLTCLSENGILCASTRDGMVYLLNSKFEVASKINVGGSIGSAPIDSLFRCPRLKKVLIGQGNKLYESDSSQHQEIMVGQDAATSFVQLDKTTIASISSKGVIVLWDTDQRKLINRVCVGSKLSCIAYNEALDQVAIGLASSEQTTITKKSFIVMSKQDLNNVVHSGCNAQKTLTTCKYSSSGEYLAFGSEDAAIYIHLCNEKGFPLVAKCRGHKGPISSIDFGTCNGYTFIRSNSYITGEALFWRSDGKSQTPMSQRQTHWESQSCMLCWDMESVHDGISASCCTVSTCSSDGQLPTVFVGDSSGKVRVFSHPAVCSPPLSLVYKGHSGKITTIICGSEDSKTTFSMSCDDGCLIQWKCFETEWKVDTKTLITHNTETESLDMNDVICQLNGLDFTRKSEPIRVDPKQRSMPWKLAVVPPSDCPPRSSQLPDGTLTLEKVHGYDGKAKKNLHGIIDSIGFELVYSVAKVLVRFNVTESTQQFFIADGKIVCIALHQSTSVCAVAAQNDIIHVVHLDSMKMINQVKAGAVCLDFDSSGRYLAVLGNRTLSVFDWKNQALISSSESFSLNTSIRFYTTGNSSCIVERGCDFIRFWDFNSSGGALSVGIVYDEVENEVSLEEAPLIYVVIKTDTQLSFFAELFLHGHCSR